MRLSEMLIYADINQLSEIAKNYQCRCNNNSKHELIQSILSHSYRDDILAGQYNEMPDEQKHFLSLLIFDRDKKYSTEELKAKIKYCNFVNSKNSNVKNRQKKQTISSEEAIIKRLKDEGWLFKEQSFSQYALYQLPEDKKDLFRKYMATVVKQNLQTEQDVHIARDESGYIVDDIKILLGHIQKVSISINEIKLMNKRIVQQLLNYFTVNETLPGKHAWKFGYGKKFGEYPDRFAMLYQYCVYKGWIIEQDYLILSDEGKQFIEQNQVFNYVDLIKYWLTTYKKPIPNIKSISYFMLVALEEWCNVEQLQLQLKPYIKAFYFDNEEAILHKRILKMLLHFGVVMLGQNENHTLLVKLTAHGKLWLRQALGVNEQGKIVENT